jgi:hypothetical protein
MDYRGERDDVEQFYYTHRVIFFFFFALAVSQFFRRRIVLCQTAESWTPSLSLWDLPFLIFFKSIIYKTLLLLLFSELLG